MGRESERRWDINWGDKYNRKIEMRRDELLKKIMRFATSKSISEFYENAVL